MVLFTLIFLLLFGASAAGLGRYLPRRFPAWGRARIILLAALPMPLLAAVVSTGSILYGVFVAARTCSYEDCGGFIILGIIGISAAIGAWVLSLVFAAAGALTAGKGEAPLPKKLGDVFD